jgi:DNA (cytosine-5)-methyltransferase 1
MYRLISQCKPDTVFGEQVEGAIKHGWLDDLQTDLERENYAVGHCVLGAHSVGQAHIRKRLYWVAHTSGKGCEEQHSNNRLSQEKDGPDTRENIERSGRLGDAEHNGHSTSAQSGIAGKAVQNHKEESHSTSQSKGAGPQESISWLHCGDNKYRPIESSIQPLVNGSATKLVHGGDPDNTNEARNIRIKGYGNAVVLPVAVEFIKTFMEV